MPLKYCKQPREPPMILFHSVRGNNEHYFTSLHSEVTAAVKQRWDSARCYFGVKTGEIVFVITADRVK
jgi:hypothetical protein